MQPVTVNSRKKGQANTDVAGAPTEQRSLNLALPLSDSLSLIHAPVTREEKTAAMATGLFPCYQDESYAGEAAGLGVPVLKIGRQTVFPALVSAQLLNPTTLEKIYRLNLVVKWQILGVNAPDLLAAAMENMPPPRRPQTCLRICNALLGLFHLQSTMEETS